MGHHERERVLEQLNGRSDIDTALMEFFCQDNAKLVEQWSGRNHNVVADAVLEKIATDAARHEGGDQHVRIEEQFHETRLNTSSSVKMP